MSTNQAELVTIIRALQEAVWRLDTIIQKYPEIRAGGVKNMSSVRSCVSPEERR